MNKTILSIGLSLASVFAATGQIKITLLGQNQNIAGQIHTVNAVDGEPQIVEIEFHNQGTKDDNWFMLRKRMDVPATGWEDYLCWGEQGGIVGGTCYTVTQMAADYWESGSETIGAGKVGLLQAHIDPDNVVLANGHYRYYVTRDLAASILDSVDVVIKRMDVSGDLNTNGIIDGVEVSGDVNGDGTVGAGELTGDINGNGIIDNGEVLGDMNGNGILEPAEIAASIKKIKVSASISVYPNPATEYIQVNLTGSSLEGSVIITDVLGKTIMEDKISGTKKYNVRDFKNGVYILSVNSNGTSYTKRFVIKHD